MSGYPERMRRMGLVLSGIFCQRLQSEIHLPGIRVLS